MATIWQSLFSKQLPEGELTLVGLSFGFVVITRMLVRHPELRGRQKPHN